jgi:hypothetical protein
MSEFVLKLIAIERGLVPTVEPAIPALFEPLAPQQDAPDVTELEIVAPARMQREITAPRSEREPYRGRLNPVSEATSIESLRPASTAKGDSSLPTIPENISATSRELNRAEQSQRTTQIIPRITIVERIEPGTNPAGALKPAVAERLQGQEDEKTKEPSPPAVQIRIGQIVVRANRTTAPRPAQSKPSPAKPSLDDYLNARDQNNKS